MAFEITHANDEDSLIENLYVRHDGVMVARINLQHDCPEDHTVSRLGLVDFVQRIVRAACGEDVEVRAVTTNGDEAA